ncbi:MAG: hypothetical protein ACI9VN_000731 [Patescibacteria group bacterium]|jgi:hypothetical protein
MKTVAVLTLNNVLIFTFLEISLLTKKKPSTPKGAVTAPK